MEIKRENDVDNNINPWNSHGDHELEYDGQKNGNFIHKHNIFENDPSIVIKKEEVDDMNMHEEDYIKNYVGNFELKNEENGQIDIKHKHNIFGNDASIVIKKEKVDDMNMYEEDYIKVHVGNFEPKNEEIGHIDIKKEMDHQNVIPPSYGNFEEVLIVERPGEYKSELDIEENLLVPVKDEPESEDEGTSQADVVADGNFGGISKENIHRKQSGKLTCPICDKLWSCRSKLNKHMLVHTGRNRNRERPYECDVCNKKFFEKRSLEIHARRLHTGERPYTCEICKKSFTVREALVPHMRIHTGEKPFECEVCNKKFARKSNLNDHMRVHTGQKPYPCEICEASFTRKKRLVKHMQLIHCDKKPNE